MYERLWHLTDKNQCKTVKPTLIGAINPDFQWFL